MLCPLGLPTDWSRMPPKGELLTTLNSIDFANETRTDEEILQSFRDSGLVTTREEGFFPHEFDKRR